MSITIAAAQCTPVFGNVSVNRDTIVAVVRDTDADVIVFPELSTTGYFFTSRDEVLSVAEPLTGPTVAAIEQAAHDAKRVVVAGFAEIDGETVYNSAVVCGPGVITTAYRKTHLFYREKEVFSPGNTGFQVVNIPHLDLTIGTMICYDWRFPESARALALKGADLIACPSNLVTELWPRVMPARAIENHVYLAVANRVGTEENDGESVTFNGRSAIYDMSGSVLAAADELSNSVIVAAIDPAKTRDKSFNPINDIFIDRRPEMY